MRTVFFGLLISVLLAPGAVANASPAVVSEFTRTFQSGYREGKCGINIEQLLIRLRDQGVDLGRARVGVITNEGYRFSVIHRRNSGDELLPVPSGDIRFVPGVFNFSHHVVLQYDGNIFDYDFGNEPTVLPLKAYIKKMFWDEPAVADSSVLEKLSERMDYEISFLPAEEYLKTLSAGDAAKLDLSDFYDALPD